MVTQANHTDITTTFSSMWESICGCLVVASLGCGALAAVVSALAAVGLAGLVSAWTNMQWATGTRWFDW
jgi:hypothetical protein